MSSETENQLRQELEDLQKRFDDWKSRTKTAVLKDREKFVEISGQNDVLSQQNAELSAKVTVLETTENSLRQQNSALQAEVSALAEQLASASRCENANNSMEATVAELEKRLATEQQQNASLLCALDASMKMANAFLLSFTNSVLDASAAKCELLSTSVSTTSSVLITSLVAAAQDSSANLERHKRNVERTMKLASREQDGAKAELDNLRNSIKELEEEVVHQRNAVRQRDLAIAALEQRLEDTSKSLVQYESDTVTNANQGHYIFELEQRVRDMEREFSDRESILHEQHRDEVERLLQKHDDDMTILRTAMEDQIRDVTFQLTEANAKVGSVGFTIANDDSAYEELLSENSRLRRTIEDEAAAKGQLQREIAAAREKLSRFEVPSGGVVHTTVAGKLHTDTSQMDPQLMRRKIYDLERQTANLGEQLLQANQELIEFKATARERTSMANNNSPADASMSSSSSGSNMPQQQHAYMKAVLVKMLCAKSDDVRSSLLPVVSTLVKFSNEELKAIYSANPNWIH